jgi:TonB family protein
MLRPLLLALTLAAAFPAHAELPQAPEDLPVLEGPRILTYVDATYPPEALAEGREGAVELVVELDETGAVVAVEVARPAGHGFDEAAVAAVRAMTFAPARTLAGPVPIAFPYTYTFRPPSTGEDLPILEAPAVATYVEAPYPTEAEAAGIEGRVRLLVTLDDQGRVEDAAVTEPAGHGFDEAALAAVRAMTFTPARTAAGAVGVVFEFDYTFALAAAEPAPDAPLPVTLEGRVRQMGTRTALVGAKVRIVETDTTVETDAEGRFAVQGLPPGRYTLAVRAPDHEPLDQAAEVVAGEVTEAQLWVRALSYRENESIAFYDKDRTEVTRRVLSIEEIKRIPGTFGDPVKVIQTLPGAGRSPFGTGLLLIRGANPQDSAVYVDGIRLPIIFHLTGTTSVLSPEIVDRVNYLPGGYGAEFGRALSGTVDITTKRKFERNKLVLSTDILDAQAWFEGTFTGKGKGRKHGFAVGARRSYIDLLIPAFVGNTGFSIQPIYYDYQLKWLPELGPKDFLEVFVFGFQDILRIRTPPDQAQSADTAFQGDLGTVYQSHRFAITYERQFADNVKLRLQPSFGVNLNEFGIGDGFKLFNRNFIFQLRGELSWKPDPAVEILPGIDLIGGPYYFEFRSPLSFADLDDPLAERDPIGFDGQGTAWGTAPYLKINFRPLADRDRWVITQGVRYDSTVYFVGGGITFGEDVEPTTIQSWDPRFSSRLRVFRKGVMSGVLKASSGLYSQPPQPFQSIGLGTTARLFAERSWNSSIGFEHQINQAISWDLDVFYRKTDNLVVFSDAFGGVGANGQPFTNAGDGYAAGFELILRHAPVNRFFGWVSYTFSRSFRRNRPEDDYVPFNFDQPHIFSAQGGYTLPKDFGISAQVQVVSGNPYTPLTAGVYDADTDSYNGFSTAPPNSLRLPVFVQTSVRVDKTFTFKTWQLEAYLELINAIRGVNPEATVYSYDFSEFAFVRGLPLIPNIGLEVRYFP